MSRIRPTLAEICSYRIELQNPYACVEEKEEALALHRSENPWAIESSIRDDEEPNTRVAGACTKLLRSRKTMSKRDFERECTKVFGKYAPMHQRGILLPQHAMFISRNAARPGEQRARIARSLSKYSLSDRNDLRGLFNRELGEALDEKLVAIESEAIDKHS